MSLGERQRTHRGHAARCCPIVLGLLASILSCAWPRSAALAGTPVLFGSLEYETFGYADSRSRGGRWENFFELRLHAESQITSRFSFAADILAVGDDAAFTAGAYSLRNGEPRRPYLDVTSAFLDYQPTPDLHLRVGKHGTESAAWSVIDELKPADLLTPVDESDPFRRIDQGVYGVSAKYERSGISLDLMVVPFLFTPARLPQGRWSIVPPEVPQRRSLPAIRLDETQVAVRLGLQLGSADAAVFGYTGRDFLPVFLAETVVGQDGTEVVRVVDRSPRLGAVGVTAAVPAGSRLLLRTEVVAFTSPGSERDDFVQSAVGADLTIANWVLVANYLRDDRISARPEAILDGGERRFFQSFLFGELRYDPGWRLRARLRGGYDFTGRFWLLRPEVTYQVLDRPEIEIALVGDAIGADRAGTYFRAVRHENRVGTRVRWYF